MRSHRGRWEREKIHNFLAVTDGIKYDALMEQLVTRTLLNKKSDFGDYDTLIGITRELGHTCITDATLERLSKVARINQNLTQLNFL
jgi:hypothetical protein